MNWNIKQNHQQKHLFKSYYCAGCQQRKPCGVLTDWDSEWKSYCCGCYYQSEQQRAKEYNSYEKVLVSKQREKQEHIQQLQLLKNYLGCQQCRSKEVDAYSLYKNNRLVCWACLVKKLGRASSPVSFTGQSKWFRKYWGIRISEWLEKFQGLPVNKNCAELWIKDKQHLDNCRCLELEAQESYLLFASSLQKIRDKLEKCVCEVSEKIRVSSDDYAWCKKCKKTIAAASKKRVIKNRNDPRFWGLKVKKKVLCLECIGKKFYKRMVEWQRKKFREYVRRRYV